MHDSARHAIHSCEIIEVAIGTVGAIVKDIRLLFTASNVASEANVSLAEFWHGFLKNLLTRAQTFEKRFANEINLVRPPPTHTAHISCDLGTSQTVVGTNLAITNIGFQPRDPTRQRKHEQNQPGYQEGLGGDENGVRSDIGILTCNFCFGELV